MRRKLHTITSAMVQLQKIWSFAYTPDALDTARSAGYQGA